MRTGWAIPVALVALAAAGVTLDLVGDPVAPPATEDAPPGRFAQRAAFCAPALGPENLRSELVAGSPERTALSVLVVPGLEEARDLPAGSVLTMSGRPGGGRDVVAFGGAPAAGTAAAVAGKVPGAGSASCAPGWAPAWYFAFGSSHLDFDERLLIYNPFPEDAVVGVDFYSEAGRLEAANTADVPVPARSTATVRINEFIVRENVLAAVVRAQRGRVIAWKSTFVEPDDRPEGVGLTLGAVQPSTRWFFPYAAVGEAADQTISILNPSRREARVSFALVRGRGILQPPELAEVVIAPETARNISLRASVPARVAGTGALGSIVESLNGVAVVAERSTYLAGEIEGFETEVGASAAATRWFVARPALDARLDRLSILNVGAELTEVSITMLRERGPPVEVPTVRVGPNSLRVVDLTDRLPGRAAAALVVASSPVVVERLGYSGTDVTSSLGWSGR